MKKLIGIGCLLCIVATASAQKTIQERLYYYSPKGLTFVPPLSRPGIIYNGKLFIGKRKLAGLFGLMNDPRMDEYFRKYKANKTTADIIGTTGTVVLPLVNLFVTANNGKINWWLVGAAAIAGGTGGYFNAMAQKNLLMAALYFDEKQKAMPPAVTKPTSFVPQQQSIGIAIPLSK